MENSTGIVHAQENMPVRRPVRGPHGGWQQNEIDALHHQIDEAAKTGESLRSVFDRLSRQLGRKPNSIRNYYYAQLRNQDGEDMGRALPFETFSQDEVEQLVRSVLTARAQGMSVRACVRKLADGDHTRMLRYQNKYRSTVRTRPELVSRVMAQLAEEGIAFVSPYAGDQFSQGDALPRLQSQAAGADDPQIAQLFSALDHLLALALAPKAPMQDSDAQRRADRLSAQLDLLRIELDNEQTRSANLRTQTEGMVTVLKEFIALPPNERSCHADTFCEQATARLSAVECALMTP